MQYTDIRGRVISRLEWSATDPTAKAIAGAAVNEGQRLFCFLTLSLEAQRPFTLTPGVAFYHMLNEGWSDWIVPLRVGISNDISSGTDSRFDEPEADTSQFNDQAQSGLVTTTNPKLRPASLWDMAAENDAFLNATGTPTMYGCLGWDLMHYNKATTAIGQKVNITYARSCLPLVNDSDVPEIHDADHECLIEYGTWRVRINEGGQELISAKPLFQAFLDNAKQRANEVRARSLSLRYDRQPFELEGFDYSRVIKSRMELAPYRRENRWTGQS